ncbi:alg12 alpha-1,6-mannosyltransferase isoform X2 [Calliopsis andreniformis]
MLKLYKDALQSIFGSQFTKWFVIITVTQYHFMYYLSRPLPNIMAMPLVLLALFGWLRQNHIVFIWSSAAAIIIFRAELAMLLGLFLLYDITNMKLTIPRLLKIAVPAGIFFLTLTITIDSIFWRRLMWPEGEVFYFNTILNKSSEWGTSPFLWYFYSALPRGLAFSYFLIPLGMLWDARVRTLTVPGIVFVGLFSFLPHKELRFIIYVFPLLNVSVAAVCHRIWENRTKSPWNGFLALVIIGHLVLNTLFSMFLLCVAGSNYPGGLAITKLHRLEKDSIDPVHVHIDVLTAQTGVSRFTQINDSWIYSKQENLMIDDPQMLQFTHLLMEAKSKYSPNIKPYLKTHDILDSVDGFSHIVLNYNMLPPIRIKTKPIIFIMKRKPNIRYDPKRAETQAFSKLQLQSDTQKSIENKVMKNDTVKSMEPILDEIMESLEEFEKPLNVSSESTFDIKEEEPIMSSDVQDESKQSNEALNTEQISINLPESNLSYLKTPVQEEKTQNLSEVANDIKSDNNTKLQHNVENISITTENKLNINDEESERMRKIKERSKLSNVLQEGSRIKETVKKMIQEKLEAVKLKKDTADEKKILDDPEKMNANIKRVPIKVELPQKVKIVPKQELRERSTTVQETVKDNKAVNVRDSIRNIINQFKEFEKDFVHEELQLTKKEHSTEHSEQSVKISTETLDTSIETRPKTLDNPMDEVDVTTKTETSKIIRDAKESLKDIINQFKQIKSELTSEEDDVFDEIEATYMERPISETLMQFSEALKNLIQRRKKNKTFVSNNLDNEKITAKSHSRIKVPIENSQISLESLKNLKIQHSDKDEKLEELKKDTQDIDIEESSNLDTNQASREKYFSMYINDRDTPMIAQKSTENVSNNIGKSHASKEDDRMQENNENNLNI